MLFWIFPSATRLKIFSAFWRTLEACLRKSSARLFSRSRNLFPSSSCYLYVFMKENEVYRLLKWLAQRPTTTSLWRRSWTATTPWDTCNGLPLLCKMYYIYIAIFPTNLIFWPLFCSNTTRKENIYSWTTRTQHKRILIQEQKTIYSKDDTRTKETSLIPFGEEIVSFGVSPLVVVVANEQAAQKDNEKDHLGHQKKEKKKYEFHGYFPCFPLIF